MEIELIRAAIRIRELEILILQRNLSDAEAKKGGEKNDVSNITPRDALPG